MTVGLNVAANIASFVNTIWEDALLVARENSLASSLVTVFTDAQARHCARMLPGGLQPSKVLPMLTT